jgi:hypothetical protein
MMNIENRVLFRSLQHDARELEPAEHVMMLREAAVDWDWLLHLARRNGTMPHLHHYLHRLPDGIVPAVILAQVMDEYRRNAWFNLIRIEQLLGILDGFCETCVEAIAYKGPVMTALHHGDAAMRHFFDLDVLVRWEDLPRARQWLLNNGYVEWGGSQSEELDERTRHGYDLKFFHEPTSTLLELHWQFTPESFFLNIDVDGLWRRAQLVQLAGRTIQTFDVHDLLFILCLHFANHCWRGTEQLKWICDLDGLIRTKPLNWSKIMSQASAQGCRRIVLLGPALAAELLGTPLPQEIRQQIARDSSMRWLTDQVRQQLFKASPERRSGIRRYLFYLRLREGWREKVQRSWRFVKPRIIRNLCR